MRRVRSFPLILVPVCLLLVPLFLFLSACHKPEPPEIYGYSDLRIGKGEGQQTLLSATVQFYNPNPFSVELRRAEADISIDGKPAGHSQLDSTIYIPRKDTFYVPVTIQLDLHSLLGNALQMLLQNRVRVAFDGRVHLKRGGIPFSVPFHYESEQDLNQLLGN